MSTASRPAWNCASYAFAGARARTTPTVAGSVSDGTRGDAGWVFPTRSIKPKACALCAALGMPAHDRGTVVHLIEGKQQKFNSKKGEAERILPSPPLTLYAIRTRARWLRLAASHRS